MVKVEVESKVEVKVMSTDKDKDRSIRLLRRTNYRDRLSYQRSQLIIIINIDRSYRYLRLEWIRVKERRLGML